MSTQIKVKMLNSEGFADDYIIVIENGKFVIKPNNPAIDLTHYAKTDIDETFDENLFVVKGVYSNLSEAEITAASVKVVPNKEWVLANSGIGDMLEENYGGSDANTVRDSDRLGEVPFGSYARTDITETFDENVFGVKGVYSALSEAEITAASDKILINKEWFNANAPSGGSAPTEITWEALVLLGVWESLAQYDIKDSADNTKDYGKVQIEAGVVPNTFLYKPSTFITQTIIIE